MYISGYYPESINEGEGLRAVVFISGCKHRCKGCFSPQTWNFKCGSEFTEQKQEEVISDIINNDMLDGVTLCGGDPFYSAIEVAEFVQKLKDKKEMSIWAYTGFTYEEILEDSDMFRLLKQCDVIIDGMFEEDKKDVSLQYRGSSNQRIIDVQESLKQGLVKLYIN